MVIQILFSDTTPQLTDILATEQNQNFAQKSLDIADQLSQMANLAYAALIKDRGIVGQAIQPTYFEESYPIDYMLTTNWRFSELGHEPGVLTDDL